MTVAHPRIDYERIREVGHGEGRWTYKGPAARKCPGCGLTFAKIAAYGYPECGGKR